MYNFNDTTTALVINSLILLTTDFESTFEDVKQAMDKSEPQNEYEEVVQRFVFLFTNNLLLASYQPFALTVKDVISLADIYQKALWDSEVTELAISEPTYWALQEKMLKREQNSSYDLLYVLCANHVFKKHCVSTALFIANYCAMRINSAPVIVNYGTGQAIKEYTAMHAKVRLRALIDNYIRLRTYLSDEVALSWNIWALLVHFGYHYRSPQGNFDCYVMKLDKYDVQVQQSMSTTDWNLSITTKDKYIGQVRYNPTTLKLYTKGDLTISDLDKVWNSFPDLNVITSASQMSQQVFDNIFGRILSFGIHTSSVLRTSTAVYELVVGPYMYKAIQQNSVRTIMAYQGKKLLAVFDCDGASNIFYNEAISNDSPECFTTLLNQDMLANSAISMEDVLYKYICTVSLQEASPRTVINAIGHVLRAYNVTGLEEFTKQLMLSIES